MLRDLPKRWIVLLLLVVAFGVHRVSLALRSTEESIRDRIEFLLEGLEGRQPKRVINGLTDDFLDETGRFDRDDVRDAVRILLDPSTRYRGTLDPEEGLIILSDLDEDPDVVSVRLRCIIESRASGPGSQGAKWSPFWHLELTADMVRSSGTWKVQRTSDVNHDQRPRW